MLNVIMFHHLNTNRWDLHINQPRGESCIKHVCCISQMHFYRCDVKHKIYGLYTGKYGKCISLQNFLFDVDCYRWNTTVMLPIDRNVKSTHYPPQKD